ncbi:hypothetical protein ACFOU2_22420 [Bacillus songklensis]|uniref:Uncharacterized protein n=1 Tax=Bacillus songklensis TaxID=1069116 RepID=A0ABV8B9S5_9BACI
MERKFGTQTEEGYTTEILLGTALVPVNREAAPPVGVAIEELEEMKREKEAKGK